MTTLLDADGKLRSTVHQLHHTRGTEMVEQRSPLHVAQQALGHIDPHSTQDRAEMSDMQRRHELERHPTLTYLRSLVGTWTTQRPSVVENEHPSDHADRFPGWLPTVAPPVLYERWHLFRTIGRMPKLSEATIFGTLAARLLALCARRTWFHRHCRADNPRTSSTTRSSWILSSKN